MFSIFGEVNVLIGETNQTILDFQQKKTLKGNLPNYSDLRGLPHSTLPHPPL